MRSEWDLKGKKILVTGASSGLGLTMADSLLRSGAEVCLASRQKEKLDSICQAFKDSGFLARAVHLDVRNADSVDKVVAWATRNWGSPDLVVNNAGIAMISVNRDFIERPMPFFQVDPAKFRDMFETNVVGYFLVASAFSKLFVAQGKKGRIVNVSISSETMTRRGFVPYGPSRAATEAMSSIMAKDMKEYGVAVNTLLPGGLVITGLIPSEYVEKVKYRTLDPVVVMGRPITFLASDEAEGLTGELIDGKEFDSWLGKFRSSK